MLRRLTLISLLAVCSGIAQLTDVSGTSAALGKVTGVAVDSRGNLFMALFDLHVVVRLDAATGILSMVAGTFGSRGFRGDNGPATSAYLNAPIDVAVDSSGNVYIADYYNFRVRKVSKGVITTVAGNGTSTFGGDNGPANKGQFLPLGVAVDTEGNLYIADFWDNRVRKVANGIITTFAGNGTQGFSGDNGPGTSAQLAGPTGVAVDTAGNVYIADYSNNRVRKVTNGVISTVSGTGIAGFAGDNGPATSAQLSRPYALSVDSTGNLYIADANNYRIRKVSAGTITTVAGNGQCCFAGDDGPATNAQIWPADVAVDSAGSVYVTNDQLIRKVSNGVIKTVAGNGTSPYAFQVSDFRGMRYPVQGGTYVLSSGDFNGDGFADLLTVTHSTSFNLLLGNGDGTFQPALRVDIPKPVNSIAVGDVNRDGKLDFVAAVTSTGAPLGSVVLFTGKGDGTFNEPVFLLPDRLQADHIALADVNGDGILDLIGALSSSSTSGAVSISLGNRDESFAKFEEEPVAGVQSEIAIADFNGDRLPDVAVSSPQGVISVLLRKSSTSFPMYQKAIFTTAGRTGHDANFAVGDLNGDGLADIAAPAQSPDRVIILLSKGDGTFHESDIAVPSSGAVGQAALGDFNADGKLDLIVDSNYHKYLSLGMGDGSFQTVSDLGSPPGGFYTFFILVGDYNADHLPDFVTADDALSSGSAYVTVWLNAAAKPPVITSPLTVQAIVGSPFRYQITATNNPTSYDAKGLPPGVTLDPTIGVISGTPTVAQTAVLTITASNSAGTSAGVTVTMIVNYPAATFSAVVNGASSVVGVPVAPGGIATAYGNFPGVPLTAAGGSPLPNTLGGMALQLDNGYRLPLFAVSPGQVNFQIPWDQGGQSQVVLFISINSKLSAPQKVALTTYAPGIFSVNAQGNGQGAILDLSYRLVDASNPARAGADAIQIYCTGLGPVTNRPVAGSPALSNPLSQTTLVPTVTIGGASAKVLFSGLAPGAVGEYQVNVQVPADSLKGAEVPVTVAIGNATSNTVTIAVR